jgi:predicted pyridoxine 5'-phosphate oxidase superfamily flavin-nucleotide-binding protein
MAKITEEVAEIIKDQGAPKIVATVDKDGVPNVTIKGSLMAPNDETLAFADLYGGKSRTFTNLEETKQVSVLVFKFPFVPPFSAYQIKGRFTEYQKSGPIFDQFAKVIKDAIGADITGVAMIKVESVYSQSPQDAGKKVA